MHVHFIGVAGTGMGSLATLFLRAGHRVTGSDLRFDPPMGDVLRDAGVLCAIWICCAIAALKYPAMS